MITLEKVNELVASKEQNCLTLYLNTGPSESRARLRVRFNNLVRGLSSSCPPAQQKAMEKVIDRVFNYLNQYQTKSNSILIFATEKDWQEFASRVPVRDELWWGKPNVNQLLWLLQEYHPYGVLIPDRQKVTFLAIRMNEIEELKEFTTKIDTNKWRQQLMKSSARGQATQKGGRNLDAFADRFMNQVTGFWRSLRKPLAELVERYHVKYLAVAGNKSLLPEFTKTLPQELQAKLVKQINLANSANPTMAVRKVFPEIEKWELETQTQKVKELLDAAGISNKAALGLEPTLKYIQEGRASQLIIAKNYDCEVRECAQCQLLTANHSPTCRSCSAENTSKISLAAVLPRLVAQRHLPFEVVRGQAGELLSSNGGIGVHLRF